LSTDAAVACASVKDGKLSVARYGGTSLILDGKELVKQAPQARQWTVGAE